MSVVPTKSEYSYLQLRKLIVSGNLPPGSTINQDQLSSDLGVSTTPIREALRRLSAEGFVVIDAHRDARVVGLGQSEARDLLEVRTTLEVLAIQLACERATTRDLVNLEHLFSQMSHRDYRLTDDALNAHRQFHHSIHIASQNQALHTALVQIYNQCDRYVRFGIESSRASSVTDDYSEHGHFIELIRKRDSRAAEELMLSHVQNSLLGRALLHLSKNEVLP